MNQERWIWIGGWGLPPKWLREKAQQALPAANHTVVAPTRDILDSIDWTQFDRAGGYSYGAFLLLQQARTIPLPVLLLAPFFAFAAEAGLGGKTERTRIRYLARWLKRNPPAALADFYTRAGLHSPIPPVPQSQTSPVSQSEIQNPKSKIPLPFPNLPYSADDLAWGLDQLALAEVPPPLPIHWIGLIGEQDSLLDARTLARTEPRLQVVPGAGHEPTPLLAATQMTSLR